MLRSKYQCENFSVGDKELENDSGPEKLFFELASESRLAILRELQKENLKMQEIARRLDVTATEAFRQLERLSTASLVQRQPDGSFAISEYGKIVMQLSSSLEFVSKHKDYFSTHDIMRLPIQFISRLGELSQADLSTDTIANLNKCQQAFLEAEEFGCGMAEGTIPELMATKMDEKIQTGLSFKFLLPESRFPSDGSLVEVPKNVQMRALSELPVVIVVTEKFAGICFLQVGGKVDYAGFFGDDLTFVNWVKDLFMYYWEKSNQTR
jgi:predicted transcriptional regulator